ncbi:MAG: peroxiredoxin [Methanosphaera sp.]|nr:peroxiredoxin [Methanosphaera sp.]
MLTVGTKAPDFSLPDYDGKTRKLSDFRGQKIILYFFHKITTAGCKNQACTFMDLYPQFDEKGATIIGISRDSVETQKGFQEEYKLPFILLSDTEMEVIKQYDVLKEKKNVWPANNRA